MTAALVAGLLAGLGVALPVGAVGAYLVALTARSSLRVGAAAALGVATADGLYAAAAMIGGGALADLIRPAAEPLRWIAAVVLLVLAVRVTIIAIRRHCAELPTARRPPAEVAAARLRPPPRGRTFCCSG